jgi:hypothetical protein
MFLHLAYKNKPNKSNKKSLRESKEPENVTDSRNIILN